MRNEETKLPLETIFITKLFMSNDVSTLNSVDFTLHSTVTQKSLTADISPVAGLFITGPFLKDPHGLTKHGRILTLAELDAD